MVSPSYIVILAIALIVCNQAYADKENFIIFKNSTSTYAVDSITGKVIFQGNDFDVLNNTINSNSSEIKIIDNNYTIDKTLVISKPIYIHGNTETWTTFTHKQWTTRPHLRKL